MPMSVPVLDSVNRRSLALKAGVEVSRFRSDDGWLFRLHDLGIWQWPVRMPIPLRRYPGLRRPFALIAQAEY